MAWRCLDAQYWGVPQRRKRIFLVADFAGQSAEKILFDQESLLGYPA
ncbi:MAG: DNA cytosine methyltransferase [Oscillospiraceae bacterium]